MSLSVVFHHGGHFVRDWIISYKGGEKTVFKRLDPDKWTYFEITSLVEEDLKVSKGYRFWWMHDEDVHFRLVRLDEDAYEVKDYALSNNCAANIFVEHNVDETSGLVDVPKYINPSVMGESSQVVDTDKGKNVVYSDNENEDDIDVDDEVDFSSSDEDVRGVTFDDSEDERALGLEDGFEHVETSTPMNVTNCLLIEGKSCEPDWDMGYISEELNSDDPDDSDIEKGPRAEIFNMDHLNKDTEFDTGLNFKSLYEFKEAIREWSVLNNREIKYVKNDNDRVRIVCKKDCGFLVHCSRVGRKQTFKIKTWFGTHNCPTVLNNISATSKWVAKSVLKKMMVTDNVKVTDIMVDMRRNHSVGISFYRAWKAKLKAKEILEGHASKQYTLLWRYAAELDRVSRRNTCR
jgi:hypothetical protein